MADQTLVRPDTVDNKDGQEGSEVRCLLQKRSSCTADMHTWSTSEASGGERTSDQANPVAARYAMCVEMYMRCLAYCARSVSAVQA